MSRLDAANRKKAILEAAAIAFAKKSYHLTSMIDVAQEAEVSEALIYKHFQTKEELFIAVAEFVSDNIMADVFKKNFSPSKLLTTSITEKFENFTVNFFRQYKATPHYFIFYFSTFSLWYETGIFDGIRRNFKLIHRYFTLLIWLGQQSGEFGKRMSASKAAWLCLNSFQTLVFYDTFEIKPEFTEQEVIAGMRTILKGL